ncbi:MAG: CYTH domain-containing protein [Oscillospiraceae bacterium]|nr:CYTH domain-containing protein [Oscillospiraceae bacterium]
MPIEIEISYKLPDATTKKRLLADQTIADSRIGDPRTIAMTAEYYDTPAHAMREKNTTLRKHTEDGESFVSVRAGNPGDNARTVWECPGSDISSAIRTLTDMGAPRELLEAAAQEGFIARGRFEFTRFRETLMLDGDTSVEVNLDEGKILSENKSAEFREVLIKLLFGDKTVMEEFAAVLEHKYLLLKEISSKYERILRLIRTR